jgi:serine protease Do
MEWLVVRGAMVKLAVIRVVPTLVVALLLVGLPGLAAAKPAPASFADLAARLLPAVVNISTTQTLAPEKTPKGEATPAPEAERDEQNGPPPPQTLPPQKKSPFDDFFKDFFDKEGRHPMPRHAISLGSGFIVDPSGLVVTNNHVIADADTITVTLQDGTNYSAKLIGKDTKTDLALLRIKPAKPLPAVAFGNSDTVRVGDWVLAIGNPFGLGGSVTAGILSAKAREINAGPYDDFLQTDAAINRGNSGGPMFNMQGQVIGINTAIYSPSGGSIGIGFAIPSNLAKPIIEQLQKYGHARRGWLGVHIQSVDGDVADALGLAKAEGALVASVQDGGPAKTGGLEPGDVILSFDGHDVVDMHHLPRMVAETPIDKVVKVVVWRKRKKMTLEIKVGELKETPQVASVGKEPLPPPPPPGTKVLGLLVANLTPDLRQRYSIGDGAAGVVVTDVGHDSPAAEKGIEAGDVIVEVAQQDVKSPQQITALVAEAKKEGRKSVLLLISRGSDLHYVGLRIDRG